uniref:Uncharacterized protein AlNc14C156G7656 n=1 Tax=Albugo laibachii Nc14 TaxID=890382 RepID=F0WMG6_9STRA|nr:conserved hypothetical protein [Albugo laibachii Nc14]|eukprot:CCA22498.1 conserved hypothetical protein [Albugo laibachii Nc14]
MLRTRTLPEILGQLVDDEIDAFMLLTLEGALMGSSSSMNPSDHKVIGAIATYTWNEYNHSGKDCVGETDNLQFLNIELENGRLAIAPIGAKFLLCAHTAKLSTQVGLLRARMEAMVDTLGPSLEHLSY